MNKYCNLVGRNKIKDEYTKINTGFDGVEADITAVNTRVDTIITTPISGEAATQEIVDARVSAVKSKTFATLDARFEETEQDIATHMADYAAAHFSYNFTHITDGDLNDYLLTTIRQVGDATNVANMPPGETGYGLFIVLNKGDGHTSTVQFYITFEAFYFRYGWSEWSPWRKIATVIDGSDNPAEIMAQNAQNSGITDFEILTEEEEYQVRKANDPLPPEVEIERLKTELSKTDYKIIKCSEYQLAGQELPYDIQALHTERQSLRDRINELESSLS